MCFTRYVLVPRTHYILVFIHFQEGRRGGGEQRRERRADKEAIFRSGYEYTVSRSCAMNVDDDSTNTVNT